MWGGGGGGGGMANRKNVFGLQVVCGAVKYLYFGDASELIRINVDVSCELNCFKPPVVLQLFVPRCSSLLVVRLWFHMYRLFCHYLIIISSFFWVSRDSCASWL